jgi:hypothetical protein
VARQRRSGSKLPLDDPRWMPLADVHKVLRASTGSPHLAAHDLTEAMAKPGGVHSMRRRFARVPDGANPDDYPERELLSGTFWAEQHELLSASDTLIAPDGFVIASRLGHGQITTADAARGYAFFAWRPDLEKACPTIFVAAAAPVAQEPPSASPTESQRRRPGPKPTDDWPIELAAAVIRKALHDPKALGNVDALVQTMQIEFDKAKLFLPRDPKPVRALLLRLLKHVR